MSPGASLGETAPKRRRTTVLHTSRFVKRFRAASSVRSV